MPTVTNQNPKAFIPKLSHESDTTHMATAFWGKGTSIAVCVLKSLFLPIYKFSLCGQCFGYLLGHLHFKDAIKFTTARGAERVQVFS